jgi:threonine dehydratase
LATTKSSPTLADIESARERIGGRARETPVYGSETLSRIVGTRVWLKAENLQRTGSFKIRGAFNKIAQLGEAERAAGVIAASAGNHGQAVAFAARELGIHATVFMPQDAPMAKVEATRNYGAETVLGGAGFDDAMAEAQTRAEEAGATFVHAFEDAKIIAGQGTIGLELAAQVPEAETFLLPIGGGGLAAGVAAAVKLVRPATLVFGVEPEGADSMHRSFAAGSPQGIDKVRTIADSLGAPHAAPYSFGLCRRYLDELVLVSDDQLRAAMLLLFRSAKLAVEPAGAAATAALCGPLRERLRGRRVGLVVCGANIDAATFAAQLAEAKPVFAG